MEEILRKTLLYDFYGELLTAHQQEIFEEVVLNDTSFSEVAAREGVSRQSIHELVRKCEKQLDHYESCLHMMERFLKMRDLVKMVQEKAYMLVMPDGNMAHSCKGGSAEGMPDGSARTASAVPAPQVAKDILNLCAQIMEEL